MGTAVSNLIDFKVLVYMQTVFALLDGYIVVISNVLMWTLLLLGFSWFQY